MRDEVEEHQTGHKGRQALELSILPILLLMTYVRAGGGGQQALVERQVRGTSMR